MKAAYLGGTRGYQSAYYRPGSGWTGTDRRRRFGRTRPVLAAGSGARISPLAMVRPRRRPGLITKAVILVLVVAVSLAMAVVFGGLTLF